MLKGQKPCYSHTRPPGCLKASPEPSSQVPWSHNVHLLLRPHRHPPSSYRPEADATEQACGARTLAMLPPWPSHPRRAPAVSESNHLRPSSLSKAMQVWWHFFQLSRQLFLEVRQRELAWEGTIGSFFPTSGPVSFRPSDHRHILSLSFCICAVGIVMVPVSQSGLGSSETVSE